MPREINWKKPPRWDTLPREPRPVTDAGRCSPYAWRNSVGLWRLLNEAPVAYSPPAGDPYALPRELTGVALRGRARHHCVRGRGGLARGAGVRTTAALLREAVALEAAKNVSREERERRREAERLAKEERRAKRELAQALPRDALVLLNARKRSRAERMRDKAAARGEGGGGPADGPGAAGGEAAEDAEWAEAGLIGGFPGGTDGLAGRAGAAAGDLPGDLAAALRVVMRVRGEPHALWFREPVPEDAAPDYREVIARPVDLGTVARGVLGGAYAGAAGVRRDVDLVWANCAEYNGDGHPIVAVSRRLKAVADRLWAAEGVPEG